MELDQSVGSFVFTVDNIRNPVTMDESDPFSNIIIKDKDGESVAKLYSPSNTIKTEKAATIDVGSLEQTFYKPNEKDTYVLTV